MRPVSLLPALALLLSPLPALLLAAGPAAAAEATVSGTTIQLTVTEDGFVPKRIEARRGEPLTLVVTRTTERTCATEIVIKEYGINQPLPLGKAVKVTFTPPKAGVVRYACAMDMISGTLVIK